MTKAALARVIGADKVRRRPFKAGARAAAARNQAPGSPQPRRPAAGLGAVAAAAHQAQQGKIAGP